MVSVERRMPEYNRNMLLKMQSNPGEFPRARTNENNIVLADAKLMNANTVLDVAQKSVDDRVISDKENSSVANRTNPFVELNDINFNESKNLQRSREVILDKQNVLSKDSNKRYKKPSAPTPEARMTSMASEHKSMNSAKNDILPDIVGMDHIGIGYFVQAGVYKKRDQIDRVWKKAAAIVDAAIHKVFIDKSNSYKLMIGPFANRHEADRVLSKLVNGKYYDVMVVKI